MKQILSILVILLMGSQANAQFTKASLQASGLTCSMCSKAVKVALEEVPFVEKVQVDIKNQQYNFSFKQDVAVDLDALSKAVENAGFSVASLKVTAAVNDMQVNKDEHVKIGSQYFHFLNASGQTLKGFASFNVVDKGFVSDKEFKKWSQASKMNCVQTGRAAACCMKDNIEEQARVFHVTI